MSDNVQFYSLIDGIEHPVVDMALAEALPSADDRVRPQIVQQILQRGHEAALVGVIRHFGLFKADLQELILEHCTSLDTALRQAARDSDLDVRMQAVDVITRSHSIRLAYLLSSQLQADDARLTRAAAAGLFIMAQNLVLHRQPGPDASAVPRRMTWLCGALGEACASYHRHGRHDVLAAVAMVMPASNTQLLMQLRDHRSAAHIAMTRMIRGVERPAVAAAMLAFAGVPELSAAVTEGLKLRRSGEHLDPMLSRAHLLANPAVRAALRKVQQSGHLMPDVALVGRLSLSRVRMLPRWVHHLYARTEAKITAMAPVTTCRDRTARLQALRMLMRMQKIQADDLIATMCFDTEAAIARIALRHLMARKWEGLPDLLVKLISSPHADVAKMAEAQFTPMGFARFWDHWDALAPPVRQAAGAALIKLDAHFHHQLAAKMTSDQATERFKAVMIARELGQETFFEQQLMDLMIDPDTRVASSAASAAGSIGQSDQAVEALASALEHKDDRVRANAVESIEKLDVVDQTYHELQALLEGAGNRSRANAIKALMRMPVGGALGALGRMLRDQKPEHRISALWVVEQMGLEQVAGRVAELAQADDDAEVRRRALKVFRLMAQQHEAGGQTRQTGA